MQLLLWTLEIANQCILILVAAGIISCTNAHLNTTDRMTCVHYDSEGELCDEDGRKVDLQSHKYANKCLMLTAKPRKKKKRNYRDIEFDESIYEEALARKKVQNNKSTTASTHK